MIPCPICHNSGRATLHLRSDGWVGCIQANQKWHFEISAQKEQADVVAWLAEKAEREIDTWDVIQIEQVGQGRLI